MGSPRHRAPVLRIGRHRGGSKPLEDVTEDEGRDWFVGMDWAASQTHRVVMIDAEGRRIGERGFTHGGESLAAMAAWISKQTGAAPDIVSVAIEGPHGPVVESLMGRGFRVHSINPKQLDRFRDRFSPAGAEHDMNRPGFLGGWSAWDHAAIGVASSSA